MPGSIRVLIFSISTVASSTTTTTASANARQDHDVDGLTSQSKQDDGAKQGETGYWGNKGAQPDVKKNQTIKTLRAEPSKPSVPKPLRESAPPTSMPTSTLLKYGEQGVRFFDEADGDLRAHCPALVILVINLPKKQGGEVLQLTRQLHDTRTV